MHVRTLMEATHVHTYVVITVLWFTYVACEPQYKNGLLWERHQNNQLARIRCSAFHSNFRSGVYITRICNENGEWGVIDFSSCTMRSDAKPLLVFEINSTSLVVNAEGVMNDVSYSLIL